MMMKVYQMSQMGSISETYLTDCRDDSCELSAEMYLTSAMETAVLPPGRFHRGGRQHKSTNRFSLSFVALTLRKEFAGGLAGLVAGRLKRIS